MNLLCKGVVFRWTMLIFQGVSLLLGDILIYIVFFTIEMKWQGTNMWSEGIVEDGIKPFLMSTMRFSGPRSIHLSIHISIHPCHIYIYWYIYIWYSLLYNILCTCHTCKHEHIYGYRCMYIAIAYTLFLSFFLFSNPLVVGLHGGYV